MPKPRPVQPATPARDAFEIHRAEVAEGMSLAYLREGIGGYPLVLVHGYPETKRIWWRNIGPLAHAGFDLVRANSIKVILIAALTLIAVPVFAAQRQIDWNFALPLAAGFAAGGILGARLAVLGGEKLIRPVLIAAVMALAARMLSVY